MGVCTVDLAISWRRQGGVAFAQCGEILLGIKSRIVPAMIAQLPNAIDIWH